MSLQVILKFHDKAIIQEKQDKHLMRIGNMSYEVNICEKESISLPPVVFFNICLFILSILNCLNNSARYLVFVHYVFNITCWLGIQEGPRNMCPIWKVSFKPFCYKSLAIFLLSITFVTAIRAISACSSCAYSFVLLWLHLGSSSKEDVPVHCVYTTHLKELLFNGKKNQKNNCK